MIQPTAPQPTTPGEQSEMGQQLSAATSQVCNTARWKFVGYHVNQHHTTEPELLNSCILFHSFVDREYIQLYSLLLDA